MRQGYGSQSNLSGWRFSVGSVPLNERRSREGNGEKVGALQGGTGRRDVRRKNGDGVGKGVRVSLPHPYLLIFLPLSYFAQHSTISTPGIGYSTNKPVATQASEEQDQTNLKILYSFSKKRLILKPMF